MRHLACKPGSVGQLSLRDGQPAGGAVAGALVQPTRPTAPGTGLEPKPRVVPSWSCSRWGLPCDPCCQAPGALLPQRGMSVSPKPLISCVNPDRHAPLLP